MSLMLAAVTAVGFLTAAQSGVSPTAMRQERLDSLATEAARLSARFADRRVAIAEGYRRVGTDFPSMGEHWLHTGVLLAQRVDAARPTILMYTTIDGAPRLLGVGFVVTTRGDSLALGTPGWPEAWHEHSGLLSDESGAGAGHRPGAGTGTQVWVLHIWTTVQNPAGRFESDNWSLPFHRAGLAAPPGVDADVGRAFSLSMGGDDYLRRVLSDAGLRRSDTRQATDAAIAVASAAATGIAARSRAAGHVGAADADELRQVWRALGDALRDSIGAAVEPFLAPPHSRGTSHAHPTS